MEAPAPGTLRKTRFQLLAADRGRHGESCLGEDATSATGSIPASVSVGQAGSLPLAVLNQLRCSAGSGTKSQLRVLSSLWSSPMTAECVLLNTI